MTRKKQVQTLKCVICGDSIHDGHGWKDGHNAAPVANGRCCSICNATRVIPARMLALVQQKK